MNLNIIGRFMQTDGYGRFTSRLVKALLHEGVQVKVGTVQHLTMPDWLLEYDRWYKDALTISCLLPEEVRECKTRQWLYTMIEGSELPHEWAERINVSGVERVIVPCQHNALAFEKAGVLRPISVVPLGVDPIEFPYINRYRSVESINPQNPYTFLALADRGGRKGWEEVLKAFYIAFGGKTDGDKSVRLIIKARPKGRPGGLELMRLARERDKRIVYQVADVEDMQRVYAQADMGLFPSRCEGWGLPHREMASMGIPVVTQRYSGLDDGYTERWSMPLREGAIVVIPKEHKPSLGEWMIADVNELAQVMKWSRYSPETAAAEGTKASRWLRENQTWQQTAKKLLALIGEEDGLPVERTTLPLFV